MRTMLTDRRRIARIAKAANTARLAVCVAVLLGCAFSSPAYGDEPTADVPPLIPIEQAVAAQAAKADAAAAAQADNEPELISIADDADGTVNIFELAKELEHAILAQQHAESAVNPGAQAIAHEAQKANEADERQQPLRLAQLTQTQQTKEGTRPPAADNVPPAVKAQQRRGQTTTTGATSTAPAPTAASAPAPSTSSRPTSTRQTPPTANDEIARIKAQADAAEKAYIDSVRQEAYRQVELEAFPMTPAQIKQLRQRLDETQRAKEAYPGTPPQPVSTSLIVNLSPGTTPPVIRLGMGFVSSLVFVDATGAPWQIQSYDVGAPEIFNVQWDKDSNLLLIQSLKPYTYGNIAVNLVGLNTPVMLTLIPGQKVIDYRVDLRVQALGPNPNEQLLGDGMPANANALLLNFLNGAPPDAADVLTVHGSHTQAWVFQNRLYVRSRFKVLSPSWLASMSSADGTHVYELPKTPVLLLSRHGKVVSMQLEGF